MDNKARVQLNEEALDKVVGGILIQNNVVTNKDTGETYTLLTDPMTAFQYAMSHGKESDTEIIKGMLKKHYIK